MNITLYDVVLNAHGRYLPNRNFETMHITIFRFVCWLVGWLTGDIARSLSADDIVVDRCRQCKRVRRCVITKLNSFSLDANRKISFQPLI